uniref:Uncharacterized protein n=1 Tax=Timema bartmani TaxID=61472 RepID=A0A7R9I0A7_9NEOP|nr:unnamed protein product [Timema bartmani]
MEWASFAYETGPFHSISGAYTQETRPSELDGSSSKPGNEIYDTVGYRHAHTNARLRIGTGRGNKHGEFVAGKKLAGLRVAIPTRSESR